MYQHLLDKQKTLAVIGLGYVGLPIALEFAKKIKVIGFDINAKRVELMRNSIDPSQELEMVFKRMEYSQISKKDSCIPEVQCTMYMVVCPVRYKVQSNR